MASSSSGALLVLCACRGVRGDSPRLKEVMQLRVGGEVTAEDVYIFEVRPGTPPARDPWHTARLSLPATCDCRPADDMLLATEGAYQQILGSRGAPAVPHHFVRVGSQRTGCSKLSPL